MSDLKTAPFLTVDIFDDIPGIKHGFFTRQGGVSEGIFAELNIGAGSDDDPKHVAQNMNIICHSLGIEPAQLNTLYQTHSNTVHICDHNPTPLPDGDGFVTDKSDIALGIKTADCVPLLFACKKSKVIGACHAGWGGAFKGITQNTIQSMIDQGADASSIHVAIGPCLHQKDFEVGPEFVDRFTQQSPENTRYFIIPDGKETYHFDIIGYLTEQLNRSGISKIVLSDHNTYENEDLFYSYRRSCHKGEIDYGRQLSVIVRTD